MSSGSSEQSGSARRRHGRRVLPDAGNLRAAAEAAELRRNAAATGVDDRLLVEVDRQRLALEAVGNWALPVGTRAFMIEPRANRPRRLST